MNYTKAIALARMEALGALQRVKDNPAETRRIALAIFAAPEPDDDIDEALEPADDDAASDDDNPSAPAEDHATEELDPDGDDPHGQDELELDDHPIASGRAALPSDNPPRRYPPRSRTPHAATCDARPPSALNGGTAPLRSP